MPYPEGEMDQTPEQPPIAERPILPQTEEELEQMLNAARRGGAIAAINSVHEEVVQTLSTNTGYMELIKSGLVRAAATGGLTRKNFRPILQYLEEILKAGKQESEILSRYQQAAVEGRINFAEIGSDQNSRLQVLDIHPQVQPSTVQGISPANPSSPLTHK